MCDLDLIVLLTRAKVTAALRAGQERRLRPSSTCCKKNLHCAQGRHSIYLLFLALNLRNAKQIGSVRVWKRRQFRCCATQTSFIFISAYPALLNLARIKRTIKSAACALCESHNRQTHTLLGDVEDHSTLYTRWLIRED